MGRKSFYIASARVCELRKCRVIIHQSEMSQSEMSQSEMSQSERDQPERDQPEMSQPEMSQPERDQPEMSQPEMSQHERDQPERDQWQFVLLLEEVRQLQEGQEDVMLKLEKGVHNNPYIFKCHGNENQYHFCKEIADCLTSTGASRMWWQKGSLRQSQVSAVRRYEPYFPQAETNQVCRLVQGRLGGG